MEIEEPAAAGAGASGGCFPFHMCGCMPRNVRMLIPGTWQKIQDFTHLILVIGVFSTFIQIVPTIASIKGGCFLHSPFCAKEILVIVFICPCCYYFVKIIGQYDEKLQSKHAQARVHKETLARSYNDLLCDMDGLLGKAAESSAGLAERSFESKRRDFQRFLERAKANYGHMYSNNLQDQLFKQFRRFCINWLQVFEECSIDPINNPKTVVDPEELNRCTSIVEVCDLCLERLRVTEVRFISVQRDEDAKILKKSRVELKRLTVGGEEAKSMVSMRMTTTTDLMPSGQGKTVSWFTCGPGSGCGYTSAGGADGFPKEASCGCCRLVLLSKEHLMLMFAFFVGFLIIGLDMFFAFKGGVKEHPVAFLSVIQVLVTQFSIVVMLLRFEELDIIQQLEREVKGMEQQVNNVEKQRKKMRDFWSNAQQLTELWLYRTVPRLDLFKEIHSQLEDASSEDLLSNLSGANQQLENLETNLGALEAWRNDGNLNVDSKKTFGKVINQLCQETEFDEILVKLEEVANNKMKNLTSGSTTNALSSTPSMGPAMSALSSMQSKR